MTQETMRAARAIVAHGKLGCRMKPIGPASRGAWLFRRARRAKPRRHRKASPQRRHRRSSDSENSCAGYDRHCQPAGHPSAYQLSSSESTRRRAPTPLRRRPSRPTRLESPSPRREAELGTGADPFDPLRPGALPLCSRERRADRPGETQCATRAARNTERPSQPMKMGEALCPKRRLM